VAGGSARQDTSTRINRGKPTGSLFQPGVMCPSWAQLGLPHSLSRVIHMLARPDLRSEENPGPDSGETGSGKDCRAASMTQRTLRTLRSVQCAAARGTLGSRLFGARKGAYTGAIEHRQA